MDLVGGEPYEYSHEKLPKNGKILSHLGFSSKILPGPLTDLSAWGEGGGFCTSSPKKGVKYQLSSLDFLGGAINIPLKIANGRQSSSPLAV